MRNFRQPLVYCGAALAFVAVAGTAHAQSYPVKPIRLVAPFAPGGSTDILARIVAQKLTEAWGQQVNVENRAGGGSVIGTDLVAKAAPDGYTLLMTSTSTATAPSLMKKLPYDTLRDLTPVIQLVSTPNALVVHPSLPVANVRELIALARSRPDQIAFGSGGNGTSTHLGGEILRLMAGVRMTHVPFKGAAPSLTSLLSGEVSWVFSAILPVAPLIKAGRLRAIAVSSAKPSLALPGVPPVGDTLAGFDTSPWTGVAAPGATPRDIIQRLNQEIARGYAAPDVRERLQRDGNEVVLNTPEQFDAFFRGEMDKWAKVIKAAGITLQ
ncbi:MAG: tripartite tricarboxylate transporter substrate binding protein [Betaproteobacteria bacterium]|nr:tripartite tricarboxylate transporter substrate binding protein [Betaproteobacteria bacterium]